jgi:hypothetical protein
MTTPTDCSFQQGAVQIVADWPGIQATPSRNQLQHPDANKEKNLEMIICPPENQRIILRYFSLITEATGCKLVDKDSFPVRWEDILQNLLGPTARFCCHESLKDI